MLMLILILTLIVSYLSYVTLCYVTLRYFTLRYVALCYYSTMLCCVVLSLWAFCGLKMDKNSELTYTQNQTMYD